MTWTTHCGFHTDRLKEQKDSWPSPLSVQMTKENRVLKRMSHMLMPLIPENPEAVTSDPQPECTVNCDVGEVGEESSDETLLLLESQTKIAGLTKLLIV